MHAVKQLPNGFFTEDHVMEKKIQDAYDSIPDLKLECHAAQLENVLKAISGKEPLLIDGDDGKRALDVIYGIYQSAIEKHEVAIPVDSKSPFYTKSGMLEKAPVYHEKSVSVDNLDGEITLGRN